MVAILREGGSNGDREMGVSFHLGGCTAVDVTMSDLIQVPHTDHIRTVYGPYTGR